MGIPQVDTVGTRLPAHWGCRAGRSLPRRLKAGNGCWGQSHNLVVKWANYYIKNTRVCFILPASIFKVVM